MIIIRLKQPFVDWIKEADPYENSENHISIEEANNDSTAFLVPQFVSDALEDWLEKNYQPLFEQVLEEWYVEPSLWPQDISLKLFKAWCDVEVHSMVVDMVDEPLEDDDYD